MTAEEEKEWEETKKLIEEFKLFDTYVIATPMWNWNITYRLKKLMDNLIQPGITFDPQTLKGKIRDKRVYVFITAAK